MNNKELFQQRFNELFPESRLLAIQLNGFTHKIFFDNGNSNNEISRLTFSNYLGNLEKMNMGISIDIDNKLKTLFAGFSNLSYQNNATEIVYILPNER
jgi:hypothetical protein